MTDIRIKDVVSLEGSTMDWLLRSDGTLDDRAQLASAVLVALGTDAMATADDVLPDPDSTDRRGWWGDMDCAEIWGGWPVGCKNWLLTRAKISDSFSVEGDTVERARLYSLMALQPFVDQGIASSVTVTADRVGTERIDVTATIYRGPLDEINLRFQVLWQEQPLVVDDSWGNN